MFLGNQLSILMRCHITFSDNWVNIISSHAFTDKVSVLSWFFFRVCYLLSCMSVSVVKRIVSFYASEYRLDLHLRLGLIHDWLIYHSVNVSTWFCQSIHSHYRHFLDTFFIALSIYSYRHFWILINQLKVVSSTLLKLIWIKLDVSLRGSNVSLWLHDR